MKTFLCFSAFIALMLAGCASQPNHEISYPRLQVETPKLEPLPSDNENRVRTYKNEISHLNSLKDTIYSESN